MSATIGIKDSTFVIFGSGHDYTRIDSGEGEKIFFSHPKVPLNSVNYAGQYYFLVPDENGDPIDAVQDDISHCTFTPALGTAFDTEGEATVKVKYRREYIHDEETILVEKELTQKIEVVDHGTVSTSATSEFLRDIYSDGYIFWHPRYTNVVSIDDLAQGNEYSSYALTGSSNIHWRVRQLGYIKTSRNFPFIRTTTSMDLSELEKADTSSVHELHGLFSGNTITDLSVIKNWDVSNVTQMSDLFNGTGLKNLDCVATWDTSNVIKLTNAFYNMNQLETTEGLENWNTSKVDDMTYLFYVCTKLADFDGVANWDTSKITSLTYSFMNVGANVASVDYGGLSNWDVSKVTNLERAFSGANLKAFNVGSWDTSKVTNMASAFIGSGEIDVSHMSAWDVSKVTSFTATFSNRTFSSLSALSGWVTSSATSMKQMFSGCLGITSLSALASWDVSNVTDFSLMFRDITNLDVSGLASWNVAKGTTFEKMFGMNSAYAVRYISGLSDLANWTFTACTNVKSMFHGCINVVTVFGLNNWRFSPTAQMTGMFTNWGYYFSPKLNKNVYGHPSYYMTYGYYDDEGNHYTYAQVQDLGNPLSQIMRNAEDSEDWSTGTSRGAFSATVWSDVPAWN